jgi:hypothetical protein
MPFLFAPCRSGLSGRDTSALYGEGKPALKPALTESIPQKGEASK